MPRIIVTICLLFFCSTAGLVHADQSLHYAVQVASFTSYERAGRAMDMLGGEFSETSLPFARIEKINSFYSLRVGRYQDLDPALEILGRIKAFFPEAMQIRAAWKEERILKLFATSTTLDPQTDEQPGQAAGSLVSETLTPPPENEPPPQNIVQPESVLHEAQEVKTELKDTEQQGTQPSESETQVTTESFSVWKPILLLLLLCVMLWAFFRLRIKKENNSYVNLDIVDHQADVPALPGGWELRLQNNQRELMAAEGNLLSAGTEQKTFYLSSCFHGEGKTTTAINLAYGLAEVGNKKVLLVDGNSHAPKLHQLFGTALSPGLADLTGAGQDLSEMIRQTIYPNLSLMTHGDVQKVSPVEQQVKLLEQKELLGHFDYVIVDGNSTLGSSQVSLAAKHYDGVLLVIECERTKREVVQQVKERVEQVGGLVVGVILNKRKYYIPRFFYGRK